MLGLEVRCRHNRSGRRGWEFLRGGKQLFFKVLFWGGGRRDGGGGRGRVGSGGSGGGDVGVGVVSSWGRGLVLRHVGRGVGSDAGDDVGGVFTSRVNHGHRHSL